MAHTEAGLQDLINRLDRLGVNIKQQDASSPTRHASATAHEAPASAVSPHREPCMHDCA